MILRIDLEDEKDVSWGGKRTRYIYNYTFESSDSKTDDSDATESVHSDQSKTTSSYYFSFYIF